MAPFQQPELLPGLPADHNFQFRSYLSDAFKNLKNPEPVDKVTSFVMYAFAPLLFLPAWAYRFILKSTLWFWWILLFVGGEPDLRGGIKGMRARAYKSWLAWAGIAAAAFVLVGLFAGQFIVPLTNNKMSVAPVPTALVVLLAFDWQSLPLTQALTYLSALLTVGYVLWVQKLWSEAEVAEFRDDVATQLRPAAHLRNLRNGVGMLSLAMLILYCALFFLAQRHWLPISHWAAGWLRFVYGAAAERLSG